MSDDQPPQFPQGSISLLPEVAKNAKLVELLNNGLSQFYDGSRHNIVALIRTFERRSYGWDNTGREKIQLNERVWALVTQSDDERVTILERERDQAANRASEAERKLDDERKMFERDAKEFADLKELCEAYKKDVTTTHGNNGKLVEQNQKLEGDIAKLRKALGELRMKEIIGG